MTEITILTIRSNGTNKSFKGPKAVLNPRPIPEKKADRACHAVLTPLIMVLKVELTLSPNKKEVDHATILFATRPITSPAVFPAVANAINGPIANGTAKLTPWKKRVTAL